MDHNDFKIVENRLRALEERVLFPNCRKVGTILSTCEGSSPCFDGSDDHHVSYAEYRRLSALNVLRRHVIDFWNNISLPGFKYVGEPGRHRSDRYIWILVLIISLFVSAKYIEDAYKKWQGSPVLLSFNDSLTPISVIPFPAVTLCPGRRIANESYIEELSSMNISMDGEDFSQEDKDLLKAAGLLCPESQFINVNESVRYYDSSLHKAIDVVSVDCQDVIDWFKFGQTVEYSETKLNLTICRNFFQTLYGDTNNVCFAFNMLPAKDIFKENVIPPIIDKTQHEMKANWTPDAMLKLADTGPWIPRYTDSNGRWSGLYLGINHFSANESGICGTVKSKTKMYFHHPAEMPISQIHESVELDEHKELFVRLNPAVVTASEELNEYNPISRRCYFSNERPLSLFKVYTQRNCQLECRANCSLSLCDCVPISLPRINDSVKICGKEYRTSCSPFLITGIIEKRFTWFDIVYQFRKHMGHRYQKIFEDYEERSDEDKPSPTRRKELTEKVVDAHYPDCECDCPAACTTMGYDYKLEQGAPLSPNIPKTFTRVTISFKELEVTSVLRKELIGLTDFIANSGGVLGVFTGFSFLALCELVYYLTLRLWSTIKHAWEDDDDGKGGRSGVGKRERLRCCFCCGPSVDDIQ